LLLALPSWYRPGWPVRLGLGLGDGLRVVFLWGWSLMSLLFPDVFFYTRLMLIIVGTMFLPLFCAKVYLGVKHWC